MSNLPTNCLSVFDRFVGLALKGFKRNNIKDRLSIKISFMHYMKWTRVMLPVIFDEFEVAYIYISFLLLVSFSLLLSIGKTSTFVKIWGAAVQESFNLIFPFGTLPRFLG